MTSLIAIFLFLILVAVCRIGWILESRTEPPPKHGVKITPKGGNDIT